VALTNDMCSFPLLFLGHQILCVCVCECTISLMSLFIDKNLSGMQKQICTTILEALQLVGHRLVTICVNCVKFILMSLLQVSGLQSHLSV
jgi:hypothetical protein